MLSSTHLSPNGASRPSLFRALSSSSSIPTLNSKKDKPRLYLALFSKGGPTSPSSYGLNSTCDSNHWTFIVGPKTASRGDVGTCYQIVHPSPNHGPSESLYEELELQDLSPSQSKTLLVRITLAKVLDVQKLQSIIRGLPPSKRLSSSSANSSLAASVSSLSSNELDSSDHTVTCLSWSRTAFRTLVSDQKVVKSYIGPEDWTAVETCARNYVKKKRAQGRFVNAAANNPPDPDAWREWDEEEIPTWNFWERRETNA